MRQQSAYGISVRQVIFPRFTGVIRKSKVFSKDSRVLPDAFTVVSRGARCAHI